MMGTQTPRRSEGPAREKDSEAHPRILGERRRDFPEDPHGGVCESEPGRRVEFDLAPEDELRARDAPTFIVDGCRVDKSLAMSVFDLIRHLD